MPTYFIPRSDGGFDAWQANFQAYVDQHYAELGLPSDVATRLKVARLDWEQALGSHQAARAAAAAARRAKDGRRGEYDRLIREVVRRIQAYEGATDAQRAALGITVRDVEPTPAAAPTTRPLVKVDFSKRLRHRVAPASRRWSLLADESTPTRRARPRGVIGAEVWG